MRYLLDTMVFLWVLDAQANLNKPSQEILYDRNHEIFISPVSSWEIVIKAGRNKLKLSRPPEEMVQRAFTDFGFQALEITHVHSFAIGALPPLHSDPFDRMLVAQARCENLILMTADTTLAKYPVQTMLCGK